VVDNEKVAAESKAYQQIPQILFCKWAGRG
jgi:hypothetical protein